MAMATILVVDDALFMRKVLSDILIGGGHQVIGQASDGQEAITKYQELQPDLVTLDITMPNMNGIEALQEIKRLNPQAKVMMITALGNDASLMKALQFGANDFLMKPFQAERVLAAVNRTMGYPIVKQPVRTTS